MTKRKLSHKQLLDRVAINTGCMVEDVRRSLEIYADVVVNAVAIGESVEIGKLATIRYTTKVREESIYLKDLLNHEEVLGKAEKEAVRQGIYVLRKVVEESFMIINQAIHTGYSVSLFRIMMVNVEDVEENHEKALDISVRLSPAIRKEKVRSGVFLVLTKDGDVEMRKISKEDLALTINLGEWLM